MSGIFIYHLVYQNLEMIGASIALTSAFALVVYIYRKRVQKKSEKGRLQRPKWKKDVVYLVQFPVSPHVRSISPFRYDMHHRDGLEIKSLRKISNQTK